MRKLVLLCAATLAACGSSSETPNPGPTYGVVGAASGFYQASNCALPPETIGASVALVDVTDYASPAACTSMTSSTVPATGGAAALIIVRAAFSTSGTAAAPGLVAETYPFFDLATLAPPASKIPPFDNNGNAAFFTGGFMKCGATGGGSSAVPINGGAVTVTSVSGTQIAGSVNATLLGGGTVSGTFTADVCAGAPAIDVCYDIQHLSLTLPATTCG